MLPRQRFVNVDVGGRHHKTITGIAVRGLPDGTLTLLDLATNWSAAELGTLCKKLEREFVYDAAGTCIGRVQFTSVYYDETLKESFVKVEALVENHMLKRQDLEYKVVCEPRSSWAHDCKVSRSNPVLCLDSRGAFL